MTASLVRRGDVRFDDALAAEDVAYLNEIAPTVLRLLREALAEEPNLDPLVAIVQEEDGSSDVSVLARGEWVREFRRELASHPDPLLGEIVARVSGPASAARARWVLLVRNKRGTESLRLLSVVDVDVARPIGSA